MFLINIGIKYVGTISYILIIINQQILPSYLVFQKSSQCFFTSSQLSL